MHRCRLPVVVVSALATAVAVGGATASAAQTPSPFIVGHPLVHISGRLSGRGAYPAARGRAEYTDSVPDRRQRRFFEINLSHLSKLKGKHVTVFAGGHRIGRTLVNHLGRAHLQSDKTGHPVPNLMKGATVRVRHHGMLVASGKLNHVTHTLS
jgi:hypothetical protein